MTTFKLEKGKTYQDFIAANTDVDAWLKKQRGFKSRHIAQKPDGTIIDALIWDSQADGTNAMHNLMKELTNTDGRCSDYLVLFEFQPLQRFG